MPLASHPTANAVTAGSVRKDTSERWWRFERMWSYSYCSLQRSWSARARASHLWDQKPSRDSEFHAGSGKLFWKESIEDFFKDPIPFVRVPDHYMKKPTKQNQLIDLQVMPLPLSLKSLHTTSWIAQRSHSNAVDFSASTRTKHWNSESSPVPWLINHLSVYRLPD